MRTELVGRVDEELALIVDVEIGNGLSIGAVSKTVNGARNRRTGSSAGRSSKFSRGVCVRAVTLVAPFGNVSGLNVGLNVGQSIIRWWMLIGVVSSTVIGFVAGYYALVADLVTLQPSAANNAGRDPQLLAVKVKCDDRLLVDIEVGRDLVVLNTLAAQVDIDGDTEILRATDVCRRPGHST